MAERLGSALQKLLRRFESVCDLLHQAQLVDYQLVALFFTRMGHKVRILQPITYSY
jgi:hypothetical protein